MNRLLDPVRAIVADLVRKRLWPIAVVLLVALVAVPTLIASSSSSSSSSDVPAGNGAVAAAGPEAMPAAAAPEPTSKDAREGTGRVRDPFFDPPAAPAEDTAASGSASTSAAAPATAAAKPGPAAAPSPAKPDSSATSKSSSPAEPGPIAPPRVARSRPVTAVYYRTRARFGADPTTRPLTRLASVGTRSYRAALYVGVMRAGPPYAVFALGRRATSAGDATCAAETHCRIIGMRPGDRQTITLHSTDGRVVRRFVVHVTSVKPIKTSAAKARAMRTAVHPDGGSAVRAMSRSKAVKAALGRLGYRRGAGLLYSIATADALEKAAQ